MPKDNEICSDHFEDLIDDSSPLKSLIDRRIVPSHDKRVKIVGTKRPDVRDFFNQVNDVNPENGKATIIKTVIESSDQTAISEDKPSSDTCNEDSPLINNEINGNSEMTKAEEVTTKKPSDSDSVYETSLAVIKSDKRLIDHESGFKFIKWTSNHRGYKINPSKRTTWFAESRSDDENATIVSLKIRSTDPIIGDSYQHFVNQDVVVLDGGQRSSKDKLNLGVGEQFVRARSNSSPESKSSPNEPVLVHIHANEDGDRVSNGSKGCWEASLSTNGETIIETTSEKKRIGEMIRNLLRRRPTLEEIREKGILIDEPVFGCDLTTLCAREGQFVPKILHCCIEAIEKKDLHADGIYRICGNLSEVQKIRFQVNHGNYESIWSQDNVHVLTGLLKLFLRDLKEPLLPYDLFNSFMFAIGIPDKKDQIQAFSKLVNQLPKCNYHTLIHLLKHLLRVVKHQDKNRMQIQNISIIFGPTLMWPRNESNDFSYDMMLRVHCNKIVEILLTDFNEIFMISMTSV